MVDDLGSLIGDGVGQLVVGVTARAKELGLGDSHGCSLGVVGGMPDLVAPHGQLDVDRKERDAVPVSLAWQAGLAARPSSRMVIQSEWSLRQVR